MKKYFINISVIAFSLALLFTSCNKDDYTPPAPRYWLKIQEGHLENSYPQYSPQDINIIVYKKYEDWVNENNEIFKGTFDENGEVDIDNLDQKFHYVDLFTDDNFLSNWDDIPDSGSYGGGNLFYLKTNETSYTPNNILFKEKIKKKIGHWEFYQGYQWGVPYDIEDRLFLDIDIYKDYRLVVTDSYKGTIYKAYYEFKLAEGFARLKSVEPSLGAPEFGEYISFNISEDYNFLNVSLVSETGYSIDLTGLEYSKQ